MSIGVAGQNERKGRPQRLPFFMSCRSHSTFATIEDRDKHSPAWHDLTRLSLAAIHNQPQEHYARCHYLP